MNPQQNKINMNDFKNTSSKRISYFKEKSLETPNTKNKNQNSPEDSNNSKKTTKSSNFFMILEELRKFPVNVDDLSTTIISNSKLLNHNIQLDPDNKHRNQDYEENGKIVIYNRKLKLRNE